MMKGDYLLENVSLKNTMKSRNQIHSWKVKRLNSFLINFLRSSWKSINAIFNSICLMLIIETALWINFPKHSKIQCLYVICCLPKKVMNCTVPLFSNVPTAIGKQWVENVASFVVLGQNHPIQSMRANSEKGNDWLSVFRTYSILIQRMQTYCYNIVLFFRCECSKFMRVSDQESLANQNKTFICETTDRTKQIHCPKCNLTLFSLICLKNHEKICGKYKKWQKICSTLSFLFLLFFFTSFFLPHWDSNPDLPRDRRTFFHYTKATIQN